MQHPRRLLQNLGISETQRFRPDIKATFYLFNLEVCSHCIGSLSANPHIVISECPEQQNSLVPCSSKLDWQRSNEIKHDIHPRCMEREKDNFKSREVKRLKESALALKGTSTRDLQQESLNTRRLKSRLVMMFKIKHDLIDLPATSYLTSGNSRTRVSSYRQPTASPDVYKYSFFLEQSIAFHKKREDQIPSRSSYPTP